MSYRFASEEEHENIKYLKGDKVIKIGEIEELSLIIAFDYISLNNTDLCFNNNTITSVDYAKLFEFKKQISKVKIKDFFDNSAIKRKFHFHDVDLYQKKFLINLLKSLLGYDKFVEVYKLPTIYQIAVYTDQNKAPRILGFFGKNASFHILWFDYNHKIYNMTLP